MIDEMSVFDNLPAAVKQAMRNSVQKWNAIAARAALDQGYPSQFVAEYIRDLDRKYVAKTTVLDRLELLQVGPLERRDTFKPWR